ncbi:MAG: hydrogenase maturation protease [Nitrospirae bacterium]|nr:hydrogenase maturation protease [Nitrospirota bacterium]MBI5407258.1 hydrogenase maturation protease [Nitrospirota bacterium]
MNKESLLVIGLGNLLMGDDGAGIYIIQELQRRRLPDHVDLIDGGTAGVGLVDILSSYRRVIVIDAIADQGSGPSDIRLFSPDDLILREGEGDYSIHDVELTSILSLMKSLDMVIPDITIMGIPAVTMTPGMGLSEVCRRFIPEGIALIMKMTNPLFSTPF